MAAKKFIPPTAARDLEKDLAAAAALKEQLTTLYGLEASDEGDATLLKDSIEGETSLFDTIDKVLLQIGTDMASQDALKEYETALQGRRKRFERREELLRSMLANALDILGERKFERPIATFSLRDTPRKVIVTDEALVPADFFKVADPVLDRSALGAHLKARDEQLAGLEDVERNIDADEEKGACDEAAIAVRRRELMTARQDVIAAFPAIPGAELGNGGVTVSIRFA